MFTNNTTKKTTTIGQEKSHSNTHYHTNADMDNDTYTHEQSIPVDKDSHPVSDKHSTKSDPKAGTHSHNHSHNHSHEAMHNDINHPIGRFVAKWRLVFAVLLFLMGFYHPLFFVAAYILAGIRVITSAIKHIHVLDEFFLMSIASFGAILIGEYAEAAAVMILFECGEFLTDKATDKSKGAISDLLALKPETVTLLENGMTKTMNPEDVPLGSTLLIKVGERIALDGILLSENAEINNSAITGESVPVSIQKNQDVVSGGIVLKQPIEIKVTKRSGDSAISKIIELVQYAKEKKTTTEQFITKFAKVYTPAVLVSALLLVAIPFILHGAGVLEIWVYRALVFLVVSCPCALVISVPLSYFAGIGKASSMGMLFKGSTYLDNLSNATDIVFDKTGTLTKGEFKVDTVVHNSAYMPNDFLYQIVYLLEKKSIHPLSSALCDYSNAMLTKSMTKDALTNHMPTQNAAEVSVKPSNLTILSMEEIAGKGLIAKITTQTNEMVEDTTTKKEKTEQEASGNNKKSISNNSQVLLGTAELLDKHGVAIPKEMLDKAKNTASGTPVYLAIDKLCAAIFILSDHLRDDAKTAIDELSTHCTTTLLSGDKEEVTKSVSKQLGIANYQAEMLPEDKYNYVDNLSKTRNVLFLGDGINDAPVIAVASTGIAMGLQGSEAAIEAADAVLMSDNLATIPKTMKLSRFTKKIVKENITLSLAIKFIVLTLAVLGLTNMWLAVIADVGATLLVITNSLRVLRKQYN